MAAVDLIATTPAHSIVLGSVGFLIVVSILRSILRATCSQLRSIPGPFAARFSRLWYFYHVWRGDLPTINIELHRKYGPIVRISPGYYSIDDPAAVKTIYGHGTKFTKGPWYIASSNPESHVEDLFTDRDEKSHAANRRKVAHLYSMTSSLKMEEAVDECIDLMEDRLEEHASSGRAINLQYWLQCYAFDVIGAITVGKRFGFLDRGEDTLKLIPALHSFLVYSARVGVYPEIHSYLYRMLKLLGRNGIAKALDFTREQIEDRMQNSKSCEEKAEGDDFLAKLLRVHEEDPRSFTFTEMLVTCGTNVGAGSDTTSISLGAIMWGLLKNPETLTKLRAEVDEKFACGGASGTMTFAEAQKMPYLQACVQEALRRHPAPGLPMSRTVPSGGAEIAGQFFPEGNVVGINSWVAHANKEVFGSDADEFKPERWLADKERTQMMGRYWLPFGHGARTCIGKNIALLEISKLVPRLVHKFDFHLVDPKAELQTENVWFVKQTNIAVTVSKRKF